MAKQFSKGLSLNANYAWQSAKDYDSNYFVVDKKAVYGPENFSKKQAFNLHDFYQLLFGREGQFMRGIPRWANYIVGGYQISPLVSIQSGLPFSMGYTNLTNNLPAGSPSFPNRSGSFATKLTGYNPASHNRTHLAPSTTVLSQANPTYGPSPTRRWTRLGTLFRTAFGTENVECSRCIVKERSD